MTIELRNPATIENHGYWMDEGDARMLLEALTRIGCKISQENGVEVLYAGTRPVALLNNITEDYGDDGEMTYLDSIRIEKDMIRRHRTYIHAYLLAAQTAADVELEAGNNASDHDGDIGYLGDRRIQQLTKLNDGNIRKMLDQATQ